MTSSKLVCQHCGTAFDKKLKYCPSCGKKYKRSEPKRKWMWLVWLCAILLYHNVVSPFVETLVEQKKAVEFEKEWAGLLLSSLLPAPSAEGIDSIWDNSESELRVHLEGVTTEDYNNFLTECKKAGYTLESKSISNNYTAFNQNGFKLELEMWHSSEELVVSLNAPMEYTDFYWPSAGIAQLLPMPQVEKGKLKWERADGFCTYANIATIEKYNEYVDLCREKGFIVDYRRGEDYYYADNQDGYYLALRYEGGGVMYISISTPDEENAYSDVQPSATPKKTSTPRPTATPRPTVKPSPTPTPKKQTTATPLQTATAKPQVLTVENSSELNDILLLDREKNADMIRSFVARHKGEEIEIDLLTAYVTNNSNYKTRFDYLLYAIIEDEVMLSGPAFMFKNVNYYDLNLRGKNIPDSFGVGIQCSVTARIEGYENGMFILKPLSIYVIKAY